MKNVKEIAEQVNISKTSIYNLIKTKDIPVYKRDGVTYVDDIGVNLILAYYSLEQQDNMSDSTEEEPMQKQEGIQPNFQEYQDKENADFIRILSSQINNKDKTIQALIESNQALIQVLTNRQKMQATRYIADQRALQSNVNTTKAHTRKKKFWKNFFRK